MGKFDIPYLVERRSGYYWQPNKLFREKAVEVLGFGFRSLGKDLEYAIDTARSYNAAVRKALASAEPTGFVRGSVKHLAFVYRGDDTHSIPPSQEWLELSDRSKEDYGALVDMLVEKWADDPVASIDAELVEELRDSMRDTPYKANYCLRVLSVMLGIAVRKQSTFHLQSNPCRDVRKFGRKAGIKPRQAYWTDEDQAAFLKVANKEDQEIALAYSLLVYTGQRPGDVMGMTVADYDGEKIKVTQDKTGAHVWIPVHRDLKITLDAHLKQRKADDRIGGTILQTKRGQQFKERYLANRWDKVSVKAGTLGLQRRDLRRTAVTRLAEAGCEVPEIAAITGHSLKSVETILATYLVRTYGQAKNAIRKLEKRGSLETEK